MPGGGSRYRLDEGANPGESRACGPVRGADAGGPEGPQQKPNGFSTGAVDLGRSSEAPAGEGTTESGDRRNRFSGGGAASTPKVAGGRRRPGVTGSAGHLAIFSCDAGELAHIFSRRKGTEFRRDHK